MALGEGGVGHHRADHVRHRPVLQETRLHIQRLRGDPQALGDGLQDLGARLAQPALDLGQVRDGDARHGGYGLQRQAGALALAADVFTQLADLHDEIHATRDL